LRRLKAPAILAFCLIASAILFGQTKRISPMEAKDHVGEHATVCGTVASTRYAARSRGEPTFLNLDQAYPKQIFTIVIWGSDRSKFGDPTEKYKDKRVCVTGRIALYQGVAEIVASDPSQIEIQK